MRAIHIGDLGARQIVHLTRDKANAPLGAGHGLAREEHAMHPCAIAAHAQGMRASGGERRVEVEGLRLAVGGGGEGEPGIRAAGHQRGDTAEGIVRMRPRTIRCARHVQRQRAHATHGLRHGRSVQPGEGRNVAAGGGGAVAIGSAGGRLHRLQLPEAGDSVVGHCRARSEQQPKQHDQAQDTFHDGCSFPCKAAAPSAFWQGKCYSIFIACPRRKCKPSYKNRAKTAAYLRANLK